MAGHGGGSVERILENLRQYQLTKALGQPTCAGSGINAQMHDFWITRGWCCPSCKADL